MYALYDQKNMEIYGKKSIGVRFGTIDMHGVEKKSWTDLEATVTPGQT